MKIINVYAYQVLDALSTPTVACVVTTDTGAVGKAIIPVPNLKERTFFFNQNIYDHDQRVFSGYSLNKVIEIINHNVNNILTGIDVTDQKKIDKLLKMLSDNENRKGELYAPNMLMAVSLAVLKTAANELHLPVYQYLRENLLFDNTHKYLLPLIHVNMLTLVSEGNEANMNYEIHVLPTHAKTFHEALQISSNIFNSIKSSLKDLDYDVQTNDDGAFLVHTESLQDAIDLVILAIKNCGYNPSLKDVENSIALSLDLHMSRYFDKKEGLYRLPNALINATSLVTPSEKLLQMYDILLSTYPIISLQNAISLQDFESYFKLFQAHNNVLQIAQDDFFYNNTWNDDQANFQQFVNAVCIRFGSIYTFSDLIEKVLHVKKENWTLLLECEKEEVEDSILADICVGLGNGQLRVGGMNHSERVCKYNRMLEIEMELNQNSVYKGLEVFYNLKWEKIIAKNNNQSPINKN